MAAVHLQNLEFWNIEGGQMILSIPRQLEEAKKETGVEFTEIENQQFHIIKKIFYKTWVFLSAMRAVLCGNNLLIMLIFAGNLPGCIFLKYYGMKNAACFLIKSNAEKHTCSKMAGKKIKKDCCPQPGIQGLFQHAVWD